jgi:hypothetical protein
MTSNECKLLDEFTCKSREDCTYVNGPKIKYCKKHKRKKSNVVEKKNNTPIRLNPPVSPHIPSEKKVVDEMKYPDSDVDVDVDVDDKESTYTNINLDTPNDNNVNDNNVNVNDDDYITKRRQNNMKGEFNNGNSNSNGNDNDNSNGSQSTLNNHVDVEALKRDLEIQLSKTIDSIDSEDNRMKELFKQKETVERKTFEYLNDKDSIGVYPHILDPNFNVKIATKKEFADNAYSTKPKDVIKESELLCNREFELAPHQKFVKTFMSSYTPYNSLFLYHGLGTGKTCSAISICEEIREYMKLMNTNSKIHIIASPNVQENFKLQLFDKRKLVKLKNGWSLNTCAGNRLLLESNPINDNKLTVETITKRMDVLIDKYYSFKGYNKFSNSVKKDISGNSLVKQKKIINKKYSNSLIVIDEVHNIRIDDDNPNKDVAKYLVEIIKYGKNVKLLFLSATPMFHDYKEIIFLVNLMNLNDGRPLMVHSDVFDKNGNFLMENNENIGIERFLHKTRGYFSFVRGENKFSFPYRIYPEFFSLSKSLKSIKYPEKKKDGIEILENPIQHLDLYVCEMTPYQSMIYDIFIQKYRENKTLNFNVYKNPLKTVNIVYPPIHFNISKKDNQLDLLALKDNIENIELSDLVGSNGLKQCMNYTNQFRQFEYKSECLKHYGPIFNQKHLIHYSCKLSEVVNQIKQSKGVVLIYSQFIESGCIPIALALEEMGMQRSNATESTNLFKTPPTDEIDAVSLLPKKEHQMKSNKPFRGAKYTMITGNIYLSPNNKDEVLAATNETNLYGNDVKVIIISKAGSEGIDFKFIRQIHIIDPWHNLYRNEQTIGRGVRYCSHSLLPFKERNVEIYTYTSILHKDQENSDYEVIDMEMYRFAEEKALQIGKVSRIIKQNAVDCILNKGLQENESTKSVYEISLSSGIDIKYNIDDKPFSGLCDYMDTCNYGCLPDKNFTNKSERFGYDLSTYQSHYMESESEYIIKKIRQLFKHRYVFNKDELIQEISINNTYTIESINYALTKMIEDHNIILKDMFGREGYLENVEEYYMFKPIEIKDGKLTTFERKKPIDFKHREILLKLKTDNVQNKTSNILQKYTTLFENYKTSLNNSVQTESLSEWLKESIKCIPNLAKRYNLKLDVFDELIVQNIFDILKPSDKKQVIEELFQKQESTYNEFEKLVNKYIYASVYYSIKENEGDDESFDFVILNETSNDKSKRTTNIYFTVSNDSNKKTLVDPLPTEMSSIETYIKVNHKNTFDNLNELIGFLHLDKKAIMHFKTKWVKHEKGNTCIQSAKHMIVDKINTLQKTFTDHQYNAKEYKGLKKSYLCCELEIILRYLNTVRQDKIYFLNPEKTTLFNILDL